MTLEEIYILIKRWRLRKELVNQTTETYMRQLEELRAVEKELLEARYDPDKKVTPEE